MSNIILNFYEFSNIVLNSGLITFFAKLELFSELSDYECRHIFVPGITQVIAILANFLEHALKLKLVSVEKSRPGVTLAAVWIK